MKNSIPLDKSLRLKRVMALLAPLYPAPKPLLNYANRFELLVATVLAAQCTDAGVNRVTPALFGRFPDAASLAAAPLAVLEGILRPLGFFRVKARNIKALSAQLSACFDSEVPGTMEELLTLAGVGRKTASVILSVFFDTPALIVDTHVKRVALRLGFTVSTDALRVERDIAAIAAKEDWTLAGLLLNRFGRDVCRARNPVCAGCVVGEYCLYER